MDRFMKSVWLMVVAAVLVAGTASTAEEKVAAKREVPRDAKKSDYKETPDTIKLMTADVATANSMKFVYSSARNNSTFDLGPGGAEHLVMGKTAYVYPLIFKGQTNDGKYYVYREKDKNVEMWWWYFSKKADPEGNHTILYYPPDTEFYVFDIEAKQFVRTP